ncbi:MAG: hypothetical protein E7334_02790 [Clostridiales bacterium]|nr:hypothetical protein [Clostridiales bacterium]
MYQVFAGNYDRVSCPVAFEIPASQLPAKNVAVRFEGGSTVPAGVEVTGDKARVTFVMDDLLKEESVRFELIPSENCCCGMEARLLDDKVEIYDDGDYVTKYYFGKDLFKPYMGPFFEKYGKQTTRLNFTIKEHPHHRSVWISHGSVNGVDNWNEPADCGLILNQGILDIVNTPVYCQFTSKNLWTKHDGVEKLCDETTTIRFYNTPASMRLVDVKITLTASYGDVVLGETKEAGPIAVRMNDELVVGKTGRFETPFGVNEDEIWMNRAPWCDYTGKAEGHACGIAIFDNTQNDSYPTYWHSRNYGLMAPNNFFKGGARTIKEGESMTWNFRLAFHNGDTKTAKIADRFGDYAFMPLVANRDEDDLEVLWPADPARAKLPPVPADMDTTNWPPMPKWQKDVPEFFKALRELGVTDYPFRRPAPKK